MSFSEEIRKTSLVYKCLAAFLQVLERHFQIRTSYPVGICK
jgi:hypothetical protein